MFGSTLRFIHSKGEQFSPLALWPHRLRFALFSSVKEEMVSCLFQLSGLAINRYWFLFRFDELTIFRSWHWTAKTSLSFRWNVGPSQGAKAKVGSSVDSYAVLVLGFGWTEQAISPFLHRSLRCSLSLSLSIPDDCVKAIANILTNASIKQEEHLSLSIDYLAQRLSSQNSMK